MILIRGTFFEFEGRHMGKTGYYQPVPRHHQTAATWQIPTHSRRNTQPKQIILFYLHCSRKNSFVKRLTNIAYLLIEESGREFDSRLLIAAHLIALNVEVVIAPQWSV